MPRQLARGRIVITSARQGRFLVWSHGEDDVGCVPLGRNGNVLFGHPLVHLTRASLVAVGVSSEETLALAKQAVAALAARRMPLDEVSRHAIMIDDDELPMRGKPFWNGDSFSEGCGWVPRYSG